MNISTNQSATFGTTSDVLLRLLKEGADHLGWFEDSLIGACAEAIHGRDVEGSLKLAGDALKELVDLGVVIATTIPQHPRCGRMVTIGNIGDD